MITFVCSSALLFLLFSSLSMLQAMSPHDAGANPWGVLIHPDKSPAPLLEQLCLGIAQIMFSFDDYATPDLTPQRMAAFYRKVGGNYDVLFLQTKPSALSFIYQRLGCFHSIQPADDAFRPPSIPALQPIGFVRWQTIQLLLDPDEHAAYLQAAVALWDIRDANGDVFPKTIPRQAFPANCDADMMRWHEDVSRRFEVDFWKKNTPRSSPPDFNTYSSHFPPKVESDPVEASQPPRTQPFMRRNHSSTTEAPPVSSARHTRRRSAEFPPANAPRRAHSTHFRRPDPRSGYASPRAPSPPRWTSFSRPVSPSTHPHTHHSSHSIPGHTIPIHNIPVHSDPSDASSEDSSPEPPRRATGHAHAHAHTHHRNLSPPRASHARRHSHEAYARKPQRDLSPTPPHARHVNSRQAAAAYANQHRPYDSDSARHAPTHAPSNRPLNPNLNPTSNRGIHFRDPIYADSPAAAAAAAASGNNGMTDGGGYAPRPSSHRYPPTYFVRTVHSDRDLDDARRNSYHYASTNGAASSGSGGSGDRGRYAVAPGATATATAARTSPRWAGMAATRGVPVPVPVPVPVQMVDPEYAEYARGRRATMYERWDRMEG